MFKRLLIMEKTLCRFIIVTHTLAATVITVKMVKYVSWYNINVGKTCKPEIEKSNNWVILQ